MARDSHRNEELVRLHVDLASSSAGVLLKRSSLITTSFSPLEARDKVSGEATVAGAIDLNLA